MKPTDTTKMDPASILLGVMLERRPGESIEQMEARGSDELVAGESLPTEGLAQHKKLLERWGFSIGEPYADDPLFTPVTLPSGWKKRRTEHGMHSEVLDEQDRVRLGLFYKAAFYDRRASTRVQRRYDRDRDDYAKVVDRKTGAVLYDPPTVEGQEAWVRDDLARKWTKENLGDNSPDAWDEP